MLRRNISQFQYLVMLFLNWSTIMQVECVDLKVTPFVCLHKYNNLRTAEWIFNKLDINFKIVHPLCVNNPVYIQHIFLSVQSTQTFITSLLGGIFWLVVSHQRTFS